MAPAAALASGTGLSGAATVTPGTEVRYAASGLAPGAPMELTVGPSADAANGGSRVSLRGRRRTDASGSGAVRFLFPRSYKPCPPAALCPEQPWRQGQRVSVEVVTESPGGGAAAVGRVVRVR